MPAVNSEGSAESGRTAKYTQEAVVRTTLNIPDPLLVSAPNGGGLLFVHRHLIMPLLYEDATGLAVTTNGLLWSMQTTEGAYLRQIADGSLRTLTLADSALDLHDVCVADGQTYVVFTETNEVARLDSAGRVVERWVFGDEPDSAHVNCIVMHEGRLLASLFGRFGSHRGYKGASRGAGMVVDVREGRPVIEGLSQPHSLVSAGGKLWLCSSEDRALRVYNGGFELEREVSLPGYARGLVVATDHVYVGLSRSRNMASGETPLGEFDSATIAVLDRQSLGVKGFVPIPWNEIYDIRCAPSLALVNDAMASLWSRERKEHDGELAKLRLEAEQEHGRFREEIASVHGELVQLRQDFSDLREQGDRQRSELEQRLAQEASERRASEDRARHLEAQLVETRGESCKREAQVRSLERLRDDLEIIKASRSWRLTKPLRFALRLLRSHGRLHPSDRQRLAAWLGRTTTPNGRFGGSPSSAQGEVPAAAPVALLAVPVADRRDVFVWAVIDWHFRIQRPQHLSRELALAGHRVFYISNNFVDRQRPGFEVEALDESGRLFQVRLHLEGAPSIYNTLPSPKLQQQLRESVGALLAWTRSGACLSIVQHPYWAEVARVLPNHKLTYDCMDHHGGFADNSAEVLDREKELMRSADLLVVTSDWLFEEAGKYNARRLMVRNACQYEHFAVAPGRRFRDAAGRKVIGYYGAIAEWFDLVLVEKVARSFPGCLVLLVGGDTAGAARQLAHLDNVQLVGEVPYADLPYYLYGFDLCLLPFHVIPLTLATNPVKVYEYLSAGKDVVSVDLPEIKQFGDLVRIGADHASFLAAVGEALSAEPDPILVERRQLFAKGQTWAIRARDLVSGVASIPTPRVSVIVVTYNNLDLTKTCLRSLELYSNYPNCEIIVVDNASVDDTPAFLEQWAGTEANRKVILNPDNRGFAAANNQGLAVADGEYMVLLNNDTHVTPGWVGTLLGHLQRLPTLGMIGPVTNNIGNEAKIDIAYDGMEQMLAVAGDYTARHAGQLTPLRTAAFFCVMLRREVYERVGPLDEAFGVGFFEDDDYCRRVEQAGWSIACAEDVFVHHHLSASFNKLKHEKRQALFERNKLAYEAKWGTWVPHKYREH